MQMFNGFAVRWSSGVKGELPGRGAAGPAVYSGVFCVVRFHSLATDIKVATRVVWPVFVYGVFPGHKMSSSRFIDRCMGSGMVQLWSTNFECYAVVSLKSGLLPKYCE